MREMLGIILFVIIIWFHHRTVASSFIKSYYFPLLFIKLLAGVSVGLLYSYYYKGGDTWSYFYQAENFGDIAFASPANFMELFVYNQYEMVADFSYTYQPRAALMVKIVALINVLSGSNYWLTSIYFSLFSFVGIYKFANWVIDKFEYGNIAALSLFIWPSFVFWSSGILKETIAVGLILGVIATFFESLKAKYFAKMLIVLIAIFLLFLIKYYFAVVLAIILLLYSLSIFVKLQKQPVLYQVIYWSVLIIMGIVLGGYVHPNLRLENVLGVIMGNNKAFGVISSDQSIIHFIDVKTSWLWLLVNAPKALFASLFMPLIPRDSLMFMLASIENILLLGLFVRGLLKVKLKDLQQNSNMLFASFYYIFILAVFLALSTPNLGTLARYKVAFIPIVLVVVLLANRFRYRQEK